MAYSCAMTLNYCYRSTFMEVIEPHQQAHVKTRSQSVPANRAAPACEDVELCSYVSSLGQRAEQLAVLSRRCSETVMAVVSKDALAHQDVESCSTASPTSSPNTRTCTSDASSCSPRMLTSLFNHLPDSEMVPVLPALLPNPGSMAHPELCRRPCSYFAAGSCANGSACGYCHLSHEHRPSHLDRRQRDLLRNLSEAERLALLLPVLRCRAESTGLAAEAVEVLALLEDKAVACAATSEASRAAASRAATVATSPQHQLSKLSAALRKMPFSTVLGMALRGATGCENKHEEDLAAMGGSSDQLLLGAVDRMRARLAPQAVGA
ncbi:unnamed protein product [Polarella glacialis]|uniref:C3H1-type domain-containing protein n=1 Tax=Polarella glacialis TaxID=89957 RepID=A0A813GY50_POLGL|nr:unnamed protein product [Polarella glacialis]CAE8743581.1 unnamed protein product [Polarella glacialis]